MDFLNQIQTFVRIVDMGSLSKAARARRLSLPGVSRQLSNLEQQIGAALILRSTRQLLVTAAGRSFYDQCKQILESVERAKSVATSAGQVTGRLTVSAPVTIGSLLVLPRLPPLFERYPGLHIELRLEDRIVDLVADAVDVAIRGGLCGPNSHEIVAHPVLRYRRWLVASPAYLARKGEPKTVQSLTCHACLIQQCGKPGTPKWVLRHHSGGQSQAVNIDGPLSCSTPIALLELARAGAGVALVGEPFITQSIREGTLRRVLPDWQTDEIPTWLLHRRELKGSPSVRALIEALRPARR